MGQDGSGKIQETVQSAVQWLTLSVLVVPLISSVIYNIGVNLRLVVLGILVLGGILAVYNALSPNPNHFISSGRTPPAVIAEERLLKKQGGRSTNAYWCDPSIAFASIKDFSFSGVRKPIDFATLLKEKGDVIGKTCVGMEIVKIC